VTGLHLTGQTLVADLTFIVTLAMGIACALAGAGSLALAQMIPLPA
jgi:hypothetical protein